MKILMVCLGNICRSPLAEGIMQKMINENNLPWIVDSAGTSNYHIDEAPDPRSISKANEYNIDIRALKGRQFTKEDFNRFDLIYAMDRSNYDNILLLANSKADIDKVGMILNEYQPNENQEVPDPYWSGDEGFELVYRMLFKACTNIIEKYK